MYKHSLLLISVTFYVSQNAYAKSKSESQVSVGIRTPQIVFVVDNEGAEETDSSFKEIVFEPKLPTIGVIGASYSYLSLSYSHNLNGQDDNQLDYTDYRASVLYKNLGIDGSYAEYEKFRINDYSGFGEELTEDDALRPDMAARFMSTNMYYFPLAWNFDLETAFEPEELKRTGLGLGMIGSYNQADIDTPFGLVPEDWQQAFGPDGQFTSGSLSSANLQAALAFTLAPGPFYLSALGALGYGQQSFHYEAEGTLREGEGMAIKDTFRLSMGYSAKRTFFAFQMLLETPTYILRNMSIASESSDLSATFGFKL